MVNQDFIKAMQERSDEELYEIVTYTDEGDFVPDAILAAKKELESRNLDHDALAAIEESIKNRREIKTELASSPLSWPSRIAFFIFSGGLLIIAMIAISYYIESKGYSRKSSDARTSSILGFIFWCVVALIIYKTTQDPYYY